jgi:hypothetical protein
MLNIAIIIKMQMWLGRRCCSTRFPLAWSNMTAKMTSTTSRRSWQACFTVDANANGTAPYLLTCDDLLHLLHVLPHIGAAGPGPYPLGLRGAHRWTRVNIDWGRSRSTQRWRVGCSIIEVGVYNKSRSWRRPRTHVLVPVGEADVSVTDESRTQRGSMVDRSRGRWRRWDLYWSVVGRWSQGPGVAWLGSRVNYHVNIFPAVHWIDSVVLYVF